MMPIEVSQRLCSPIVSVVYCWATALYEQTAACVKAFHDREGQREMEKERHYRFSSSFNLARALASASLKG